MSDVKSSTLTRILSAIVALPVLVFCIYSDSFYSIPILILSMIVTLGCLFEYYQIADRGEDGRPFVVFGIIAAVLVNILMYIYAFGKVYGYSRYIASFDARVLFAIVAVFIIVISFIQIFRRSIKGGIYSLAVTLFGIVYIVFFFSHIILIKSLKDGFYYIFLFIAVLMLNDTGAYFGGVLFGKHKTNFEVSPNKSWEGYFSGLLFSILAMIITSQVYEVFFGKNLFGLVEAAMIGIVLGVLGHVGDLLESAVKRDGSIKDSGSIIPGHEGMWDVFDSLIFTMPVFYYYLVLKGIQ